MSIIIFLQLWRHLLFGYNLTMSNYDSFGVDCGAGGFSVFLFLIVWLSSHLCGLWPCLSWP